MGLPKGGAVISAAQGKFAEKGDALVGVFIREGAQQMKGGNVSKTYLFDCGGDGIIRILGGSQLDESLAGLGAGEIIGIEFLGQAKSSSNRPVNNFAVKKYTADDKVTTGWFPAK